VNRGRRIELPLAFKGSGAETLSAHLRQNPDPAGLVRIVLASELVAAWAAADVTGRHMDAA
jgi:hypothetical protein